MPPPSRRGPYGSPTVLAKVHLFQPKLEMTEHQLKSKGGSSLTSGAEQCLFTGPLAMSLQLPDFITARGWLTLELNPLMHKTLPFPQSSLALAQPSSSWAAPGCP